MWAAFIGWFVVNAASSSLRHFELRTLLRRIPVATIMNPRPRMIEATLPVERAISEYFLRGGEEAYPVSRDGDLIGVVETRAVSAVPEEARATTPVSAITRPAEEFPSARPDESLAEALFRIRVQVSYLLVIENGFVVGALNPREVSARVQRLQRMGLVSLGPSPAQSA